VRPMAIDAEPIDLRTPEAIQADAEAAANALLGRAGSEICARCDAVVRAYAEAEEALLCYETLAASEVVRDAYDGVRALRTEPPWYARLTRGRARRTADRAREAADSAIVDRRSLVTRTMSLYVTAWFQLHAVLVDLRAQAMHLIEAARARVIDLAPGLVPGLTPLRDEQLDDAERIAVRYEPDELRARLKIADGAIKRQIGADFGAGAPTQPLDAEV